MAHEEDNLQELTASGDRNERKYVRMKDNIPVYYEVLDPENPGREHTTGWELLFDDINEAAEENPKLYELLFDINQKVNILLDHMAGKNGFNIPEAQEVNISGGGLRFYCHDHFNSGDHIILKTFLPTHAHVIKLKCEVVRAVPMEDGLTEVAVRFVDMDESTRDKIIRYIFAKQRKLLRSEHGTGQAE